MRFPPLPYAAHVGALAVIYFSTAMLGLSLDAVSGVATAVWPPTGIALVALLLGGYRLWPGLAVGAFLVNVSAGTPVLVACGMAMGNTLEALVGATLLARVAGFRPALDRLQDVVGLVALAAGLSTLVSATIGVTSGWLGGVIPTTTYGHAWWTWWLGDAMGDLMVAPLLLIWSERVHIRPSAPWVAECVALMAVVGGLSLLVFTDLPSPPLTDFPYIFFPALIWAAVRLGQPGAITATALVSAIAIWGTAHGFGPFARQTLHESLLVLQPFLGIEAVTILVLAAVVTERRHADAEVIERQQAEVARNQLLQQLTTAQEEERRRISHELHDQMGQHLTALNLGLKSLKELFAGRSSAIDLWQQLQAIVNELAGEVHRLAWELRPTALDDLGLHATLLNYVKEWSERYSIEVDFHSRGLDSERLPSHIETTIYRVVQEALTNVVKHAQAGRVSLIIERHHDRVLTIMEDDGCGFDAEAIMNAPDERSHLGLLGMQERVALVGGELSLESAPGRGTTLFIRIPIALQDNGGRRS
jgi:two-component system, NarL family, sensor histidine kinase FusK